MRVDFLAQVAHELHQRLGPAHHVEYDDFERGGVTCSIDTEKDVVCSCGLDGQPTDVWIVDAYNARLQRFAIVRSRAAAGERDPIVVADALIDAIKRIPS